MAAETHRINFHLVLQDWPGQSVFSGEWSREGFDILLLESKSGFNDIGTWAEAIMGWLAIAEIFDPT